MKVSVFCAFGALAVACRSSGDRFTKPFDLASLSRGAEVYLPGSEEFANASWRWSATIQPDFSAIVKVRTERDVQRTIRYANKHGLPFLAISGGHGTAMTLNNVRNGIGILMRGMNSVRLVDGGKAAVVGGGTQTGELLPRLWDMGKQTVTTGCHCAGFIAPLMGGGHGWLQGRYGKIADNLLSARMVLANGTAITVSESSHKDLFWGIRGAGHNFGIYTEVKIKVYDRTPEQDKWAIARFTFTHDKLEEVFAIANEWLKEPERPVQLTHYGLFAFDPEVDADMPIVIFLIYWQGPTIPETYTDPLHALSPVRVDTDITNLEGVNQYLGANYSGVSCQKGFSHMFSPVSLDLYSLKNLRGALEIFATMPSAFRNSVVMLESYTMNRVREIPGESIAYPDRDGELLITPLLTYPDNRGLDDVAVSVAKSIREAFLSGTGKKLVAYVNYVRGDESLEAIYGYEPWRLERLRKLKAEYDPSGRFNYYAPIR